MISNLNYTPPGPLSQANNMQIHYSSGEYLLDVEFGVMLIYLLLARPFVFETPLLSLMQKNLFYFSFFFYFTVRVDLQFQREYASLKEFKTECK
jgi:hypothetical protein